MPSTPSRRQFLLGTAVSGLALGARTLRAEGRSARKFTMDLVCGNLGVSAKLPDAIALAHKHAFESIAPDIGYLSAISESQLAELQEDLKSKKLVWGAAGLPVDFRGGQTSFQGGLTKLPAQAAALRRAGASRMGTWISPGHATLTYRANFQQHATRLREIGKVLGDHGVRLGLEYVGPRTSWSATRFPFIHTMAEIRELIAAIDLPNVGFVLDS